jgi:hypothetical protein
VKCRRLTQHLVCRFRRHASGQTWMQVCLHTSGLRLPESEARQRTPMRFLLYLVARDKNAGEIQAPTSTSCLPATRLGRAPVNLEDADWAHDVKEHNRNFATSGNLLQGSGGLRHAILRGPLPSGDTFNLKPRARPSELQVNQVSSNLGSREEKSAASDRQPESADTPPCRRSRTRSNHRDAAAAQRRSRCSRRKTGRHRSASSRRWPCRTAGR